MAETWNNNQPIYLQLRDRLVAMILDGRLAEGDALLSVRQVASDYQINPLTVSKGYQSLTDDGLIEKRRGLGSFVREGATARLRSLERQRFLEEEWPALRARLARLDIDIATLMAEELPDE